jgi:predicted transglutaminase-like cysteine proteinase
MRGQSPATFARAALALAICAGLAACATSPQKLATTSGGPAPRLAEARAMPLGAPVEAPVGFVSLCMRSPIDCVHADTPQARAGAVLQAQAIARARWQRVMELAASRGQIEAAPPPPASIGAPAAAAPTPAPSPAPVQTQAQAQAQTEPQPVVILASATPPAPAAAASDARITLDGAAWTRLRQINAYVNRTIRPASDMDVYGARDWWVAPLSSGLAPYGDCKDYVLEKRRELIGAGLPAQALSIALVRTAWGESHAVLVAATSQGDLVLDNLSGEIKPWDRTPYAWVARQSASDPLLWLAVDDKLAPPAAPPLQLAQADTKPPLGR